jgi:sporulation protein YlmC with PRC-barrel domain
MDIFRRDDVVGKTVIDTGGVVRGKVKEVTFRLNGVVSFAVERQDGKELEVLLSNVTGISDHVIVKNICKYCGSQLTQSEMWCPACKRAQS